MVSSTQKSSSYWSWILAIAFILILFYRLGSWGVIDTSEARYAEIARQMFQSGDYLHPVYFGIEHYHKPPMTYWITATAYHIFGVNPFAARFFLQIALLLQLLLIFKTTKLIYNNSQSARYASLIYASFMIVWISVRNLTTDAYLNTFLLLATWSLFSYLIKNKPYFIYLLAVFAGLAFLTKITAVLVFTGSLFLFLIWQYRDKIHFSWHMLGAGILALILSLSWFILLEVEGKHVLRYMLYDQSVVRYSSDTFNRSMPFYFYFIATALLSFPWFFLVVIQAFSRKGNGINFKHDRLLLALCFILPIVFFSLSHSKLLLYILPAFWALSILAGQMLEQLRDSQVIKWIHLQSSWIILVFMAILSVPLFDSRMLLSTGLYIYCGVALIVFIVLYFNRRICVKDKLVGLSLGLTLSIVLMTPHFLITNEENSSTGRIVANWIKEKAFENRSIFIYDKLAPSFAFHLNKEVALISKNEKENCNLKKPNLEKNYYDLDVKSRGEDLLIALQSPSLLITRTNRKEQIPDSVLSQFTYQYVSGLWTVFY
ncbi:MAG: glycosyltransferase family 39 protein [Saprospiraceae bacterium]|nr:glycosyltransferase family 39 protein [Saprospiraceae bacterium]